MHAFPRPTPLALEEVPLLVILLDTHTKTLPAVVRTVPLCFHTSNIDTGVSRDRLAVLPVHLVPAAATDLASRRFAVGRRSSSLA